MIFITSSLGTGDILGSNAAIATYNQKTGTAAPATAKKENPATRLESITAMDRGGMTVFTNRKKETL
jgi:hypothetical protein